MQGHQFDFLFKPAAVAIIGASEKEKSIGRALVENLRQAAFPGPVYQINPQHPEILGQRAYPSVLAVQEPIDLAVIAIPITSVPAVLKECGQAQVKTAVIISAGGKEIGP